jgi:phosphoribosylanthranilate isomerase
LIEQTAAFCALDLLQLHGDESVEDCLIPGRRVIKALRIKDAASLQRTADYRVCGLLLDAWHDQLYGGSGQSFDWTLLQKFALRQPVILAGGLTLHNVTEAIGLVRPYAVDVSSGVEAAPGKKDHAKVAEFIRQVKTVG